MAVKTPDMRSYGVPVLETLLSVPGLDVMAGPAERFLDWAMSNSLWMFPMATSCCGIEFMATMAARVDVDRMGTFVRATPRQCDVMVIAGTITVKMAPRVRKLWEQMPEPKWAIAMGSCAISGDFYRDIYSVIPGIDTVLPVDVYVPGCPPNPQELMAGLKRLQEKIHAQRQGTWVEPERRPETDKLHAPSLLRYTDPDRDPNVSAAQVRAAQTIGLHGREHRESDAVPGQRLMATDALAIGASALKRAGETGAEDGADREAPEDAAPATEVSP